MKFFNVSRILVIKLRHIGDVLLTVPLFRALKQTFPLASTTALVNAGTEEVLKGSAYIDEILVYDRAIKMLPALRRYKREADFLVQVRKKAFDMTVDLTGGDRAALLSFLSGARYRTGWESEKGFPGKKYLYTHLSKPDVGKHIVLQNMDAVRPFGIDAKDLSIDFYIPDEDRIYIRKLLGMQEQKSGTVVQVHPTSRWLFKCWNNRSMAEIIRWLLDRGMRVAVTSSPMQQEIEKTRGLLSLVGPHQGLVDLCGATTIKQLAALSEIADLFFGVDSAPMHIAASVGTPVVALFGPSGAFNWGPWDNVESNKLKGGLAGTPYSRGKGIQTFGIHTVIQEERQCVPCGSDGCNGSKSSKCLEEIKPATVKQILSERLEGGTGKSK
ncbi:MAG TPA: putative lipopolysaccharide heptosyltransferase III [Dissulfurispiraceae bacterium]|nr:putative lipopolysaccharide heptosyltransferase III [Dissulfurispiraceae bacterium]